MSFDDQAGIKVTRLPIFNENATIDNGKIDVLRLAKNKRRQRVVDSAARKRWGAQIKTNDVGSHAGGQRTNVIAAQNSRAAKCRQFNSVTCAHHCRITENSLQEH